MLVELSAVAGSGAADQDFRSTTTTLSGRCLRRHCLQGITEGGCIIQWAGTPCHGDSQVACRFFSDGLFAFPLCNSRWLSQSFYSYRPPTSIPVPGRIFGQLDRLVEATVQLCSSLFSVKSVTRSRLTLFFSIAYIYIALATLFVVLRVLIRGLIDLVGWSNAFGLRNAIARERGIAAYRAWLPFERIRPASIPQAQWEETFAWPANNRPPYPPLPYRIVRTGAVMSSYS